MSKKKDKLIMIPVKISLAAWLDLCREAAKKEDLSPSSWTVRTLLREARKVLAEGGGK